MDAMLAVLTIGVMLALGTISALLLKRMFRTIRDLRGVSTGLNDTLRWAVAQVASDAPPGRSPVVNGPPGSNRG
jgi:hypothetical protein